MRVRLIVLLVIALLVPAGVGAAEQQAGLTKVADGVYAYVGIPTGSPHNFVGANVGVVVGDESVLVIDTLSSAKEGENLLKDIRKITDKPIRYVVNTHYHIDHVLGNNVFDDLGAVIISHALCREQLIANGPNMLKHPEWFGFGPEFWEGTRVAPQDITFVREFSVDLGNMEVQFMHPGVTTHSTGSIMVLVPGRKVLFTGDILFTDFHPYLGQADLKGWAQTLDFIGTMDVKSIVPGHGPLSDKQDLAELKEYLTIFDTKATELSATMSDPKQIVAEMMKVLPKRADGGFIVGMNIGTRYIEKTEGASE